MIRVDFFGARQGQPYGTRRARRVVRPRNRIEHTPRAAAIPGGEQAALSSVEDVDPGVAGVDGVDRDRAGSRRNGDRVPRLAGVLGSAQMTAVGGDPPVGPGGSRNGRGRREPVCPTPSRRKHGDNVPCAAGVGGGVEGNDRTIAAAEGHGRNRIRVVEERRSVEECPPLLATGREWRYDVCPGSPTCRRSEQASGLIQKAGEPAVPGTYEANARDPREILFARPLLASVGGARDGCACARGFDTNEPPVSSVHERGDALGTCVARRRRDGDPYPLPAAARRAEKNSACAGAVVGRDPPVLRVQEERVHQHQVGR